MSTCHPEHIYGNMVQEYYVARVREVVRMREQVLQSLRTAKDAQAYRDSVKRRIRRCFGPRPPRTPLNITITNSFEREKYTVQNLTYTSRPGYYVTANLYRPKGDGPFPAVLALCGHSEDGKMADIYQTFAFSLAAQGYIVLIIDPVGQGERGQYKHLSVPLKHVGCTTEHNLAGVQMSLLGDHLAMWRVWDAIRGIDVLLSLPEVDRTRIGATGNSGGGTLTTWLNAMDDRLTMAAPSCFVTTFLANLENELPADAEQYLPGGLAAGIEMADFIIAQAPRPTLLLGQQYDFFDTRGLQKAYDDAKRIYRLLGAEENIELFIGPHWHGYHQPNRESMYRFFARHAKVKSKPVDHPAEPESPQRLFAAPGGQVGNIPGLRWIFEFTRDSAIALPQQRKSIGGKRLQAAVQSILNLPKRTSPPHYRVLRQRWGEYADPYQNVQLYAVETEPNYPWVYAVLHKWDRQYLLKGRSGNMLIPPADEEIVYLPHASSRDDVLGNQVPVEHQTLYTLDVRGVGVSMPLTSDDTTPGGVAACSDTMYAQYGWMLNESYLGRRVHDVLATLDLLADCGTKRVHLVGRGLGAIVATFAGLLHPAVKRVTLKNAPLSFHELATAPISLWPLSHLPVGVLKTFDLPDCYRALEKKKLQIIEPWDALQQPTKRETPVAAAK